MEQISVLEVYNDVWGNEICLTALLRDLLKKKSFFHQDKKMRGNQGKNLHDILCKET
jgi:hypothetical protein